MESGFCRWSQDPQSRSWVPACWRTGPAQGGSGHVLPPHPCSFGEESEAVVVILACVSFSETQPHVPRPHRPKWAPEAELRRKPTGGRLP